MKFSKGGKKMIKMIFLAIVVLVTLYYFNMLPIEMFSSEASEANQQLLMKRQYFLREGIKKNTSLLEEMDKKFKSFFGTTATPNNEAFSKTLKQTNTLQPIVKSIAPQPIVETIAPKVKQTSIKPVTIQGNQCLQTDKTYEQGGRCVGSESRKTSKWCCSEYGKKKGYTWKDIVL